MAPIDERNVMSTTDSPEQSAPTRRKRMEIFRFSDGERMKEDNMPFLGLDEKALAGVAKLMQATPPDVEGETTTVLFRERGEEGLSLAYAWFKSGYVLPRHSHDADCIYYIIAGSLVMGTQTLGKGDGMFIPRDATYAYEVGPEGLEVLEFRNASRFHIHFKDNDDAYWDKQAKARADNAPAWADEVPPSQRGLAEPVA